MFAALVSLALLPASAFAQTRAPVRAAPLIVAPILAPQAAPAVEGLSGLSAPPAPNFPAAVAAPARVSAGTIVAPKPRPLASLSRLRETLDAGRPDASRALALEGLYSGAAMPTASPSPSPSPPMGARGPESGAMLDARDPWTPPDRRPLALIETRTFKAGVPLNVVVAHPSGKYVFSAGDAATIWMWNAKTGALIRTFEPAEREGVYERWFGRKPAHVSLAVSPDGRYLLAGGRAARLWSIETGEEVMRYATPGWIRSVAFAPDGQSIYVGSDDTADPFVARLDVRSGKKLVSFAGKEDYFDSLDLRLSRDGKYLYNASHSAVRKWFTDTGLKALQLDALKGPVSRVAPTPEGASLLIAAKTPGLAYFNAETGEKRRELGSPAAAVQALAFSPDGTRLATGGADGRLKLRRADGEVLAEFEHGHVLTDAAFAPKGRSLYVASRDGTLRRLEATRAARLGLPPVRVATAEELKAKLKPILFDIAGVNGIGFHEAARKVYVFFESRKARAAARASGLLPRAVDGIRLAYRLDPKERPWSGSKEALLGREETLPAVWKPDPAAVAQVSRLRRRFWRTYALMCACLTGEALGFWAELPLIGSFMFFLVLLTAIPASVQAVAYDRASERVKPPATPLLPPAK